MDKLLVKRSKIDEIDNMIMQLLDDRFQLSTEIGDIKRQQSTPVLDSNREQVVLNKTSKYSHSPQIGSVYMCIMEQSKLLQRK
jgi:chorismate mutase